MNETIDKSKMYDSQDRPLTQSLFLEVGYSDAAMFTFKSEDHFYKGKTYWSMKRLYLEIADPTEYEFATTVLLSWKHWMRLCENKLIRKHIDEWRDELEIKLRSQGVKSAIMEAQKGTFQAAKWLADGAWKEKKAGRPSKADIQREAKIAAGISDEYEEDVARVLQMVK